MYRLKDECQDQSIKTCICSSPKVNDFRKIFLITFRQNSLKKKCFFTFKQYLLTSHDPDKEFPESSSVVFDLTKKIKGIPRNRQKEVFLFSTLNKIQSISQTIIV